MDRNCVYEICVNGIFPVNVYDENEPIKRDFYQIRFRLLSRFARYEVWISIGLFSLCCGYFDLEIDGLIYINQSIKSAMRGEYLYRQCEICHTKNYYPEGRCVKCNTIFYGTESYTIDEMQNEKKSKHLGCSLTRYGSPSWSKSTIKGSKTGEKLPNL
jgi:hypothetical protein